MTSTMAATATVGLVKAVGAVYQGSALPTTFEMSDFRFECAEGSRDAPASVCRAIETRFGRKSDHAALCEEFPPRIVLFTLAALDKIGGLAAVDRNAGLRGFLKCVT